MRMRTGNNRSSESETLPVRRTLHAFSLALDLQQCRGRLETATYNFLSDSPRLALSCRKSR